MKRYFNEYSNIGMAIFIALAIPVLLHISYLALMEQVLMPVLHPGAYAFAKDTQEFHESLNGMSEEQQDTARKEFIQKAKPVFKKFAEEKANVLKWTFYIMLLIGLILLIISHSIHNSYIQVGLFGAAILVCFYAIELYEPVGRWLYDHPVFHGLIIAFSLLSAGKALFYSAYWKSLAAFFLAVILFVSIYYAGYFIYPIPPIFHILPLIIAAYFIPFPIVSVGLIYAAAFLCMLGFGVPAIFPIVFFYDGVILCMLACAVACINIQNILRARLQR
jgi:hypothetical protein